jgi:hypothetical protein
LGSRHSIYPHGYSSRVPAGELSLGTVRVKRETDTGKQEGASRSPWRRRWGGCLLGFAVALVCSFGAAYVFGLLPPFPYFFLFSFESEAWWYWLLPSCLVGAATSYMTTCSFSRVKRRDALRVVGRLLARTLIFAVLVVAQQFLVLAIVGRVAPHVLN